MPYLAIARSSLEPLCGTERLTSTQTQSPSFGLIPSRSRRNSRSVSGDAVCLDSLLHAVRVIFNPEAQKMPQYSCWNRGRREFFLTLASIHRPLRLPPMGQNSRVAQSDPFPRVNKRPPCCCSPRPAFVLPPWRPWLASAGVAIVLTPRGSKVDKTQYERGF